MSDEFRVEFDGGSRGNPGPAGCGAVVRDGDGQELITYGQYVGRATNNVAEYHGLIAGLTKALELNARRVHVFGDSELIVRQMQGQYKVKNAGLKPLYDRARALADSFESIRFTHVPREQNKLADRLSNLAIDRKGEVHDVE